MAADKSVIAVYVDLDLVGDALIKLPFLRALRAARPTATLIWIAGRGPSAFAGALAPIAAPLLDRVLENAGQSPAHPPIDILIDTQTAPATSLALRRLRPRRLITDAAWGLAASPPRLAPKPPRHLATRLDALLRAALREAPPPLPPLTLPADREVEAARLLPPGPRYIAQVLGAGGRHKVWPEAHHIALAHALHEAGRTPVLILGPDEAARHADLAAALPFARFPLQHAATPDPALTIALARRCAAAVAADCGGGHMMAAAGIPLVSLFGPTDPAKFAPAGAPVTILRAQSFGAPVMDAILVDAVRDALLERTK